MTVRRTTSWIAAVGVLAFGGLVSTAGAAQAPSCVGQFVMANAPGSAGAFGGFVSEVARTTEPNLGIGDVAVDATSSHDDCS
jgi:hypothetical protein